MTKTKLLLVLGLIASTTFVISNSGFAMYGKTGISNGSGNQIQTMLRSGDGVSSGAMLRQARRTQLREKIGTRGAAVDAIMNQWKGENATKTREERLKNFTEMHERVEKIRIYVENMNVTAENKELYRNTFEYLSLQLEDSIEAVSEDMSE